MGLVSLGLTIDLEFNRKLITTPCDLNPPQQLTWHDSLLPDISASEWDHASQVDVHLVGQVIGDPGLPLAGIFLQPLAGRLPVQLPLSVVHIQPQQVFIVLLGEAEFLEEVVDVGSMAFQAHPGDFGELVNLCEGDESVFRKY